MLRPTICCVAAVQSLSEYMLLCWYGCNLANCRCILVFNHCHVRLHTWTFNQSWQSFIVLQSLTVH